MIDKLGAKRWMPAANGMLVRAYKVVALVALTGILLGLVSFLGINLFYLFDNTWMRPVILSPEHERVVAANGKLAAHSAERNELLVKRRRLENELKGMERRVETSRRFESEYRETLGSAPADSPEELLARRAYQDSVLDRQEAVSRKETILRELSLVDQAIDRYDRVLEQIESSPYITAMERNITVAFVPYENLPNVEEDAPIYGCRLGILLCGHVGNVVRVLDGEVENSHPQDGTSARGRMLEIVLTKQSAAEEKVLFVSKRPLWVL